MTDNSSQTSALSEAKPESLEDIFNTDPTALTDAQVDRVVAYLQDQRLKFLSSPQKAEGKRSVKVDAPVDISIESLGL